MCSLVFVFHSLNHFHFGDKNTRYFGVMKHVACVFAMIVANWWQTRRIVHRYCCCFFYFFLIWLVKNKLRFFSSWWWNRSESCMSPIRRIGYKLSVIFNHRKLYVFQRWQVKLIRLNRYRHTISIINWEINPKCGVSILFPYICFGVFRKHCLPLAVIIKIISITALLFNQLLFNQSIELSFFIIISTVKKCRIS